jgi:hypothetical protein
MGDRGFLLLFGAISAVVYTAFAFTPVTYETLLIAMVLLTTAFLFASCEPPADQHQGVTPY